MKMSKIIVVGVGVALWLLVAYYSYKKNTSVVETALEEEQA